MDLGQQDPAQEKPQGTVRQAAARCWAMLLARIYECLPLSCPSCGKPMRLIAFIMEPPVVEEILMHIGEPTEPPAVLPARAPPQVEIDFDQVVEVYEWPDMDQMESTSGQKGETMRLKCLSSLSDLVPPGARTGLRRNAAPARKRGRASDDRMRS